MGKGRTENKTRERTNTAGNSRAIRQNDKPLSKYFYPQRETRQKGAPPTERGRQIRLEVVPTPLPSAAMLAPAPTLSMCGFLILTAESAPTSSNISAAVRSDNSERASSPTLPSRWSFHCPPS